MTLSTYTINRDYKNRQRRKELANFAIAFVDNTDFNIRRNGFSRKSVPKADPRINADAPANRPLAVILNAP